MTKIVHKFTIEAPASEVYKHLTSLGGLQKWWMKDSRGSTDLNGELEFGNEEMWYTKMKVSNLEENKKVVWQVVDNKTKMEDFVEWNGSTIEFELEEKQLERLDGKTVTVVLFKHDDLPDEAENSKPLAEMNWHWAFFTAGLKNVAEGREGNPM